MISLVFSFGPILGIRAAALGGPMEVRQIMLLQTARRWLAIAGLCLVGGSLAEPALAQQRPSLVRVDPVRNGGGAITHWVMIYR